MKQLKAPARSSRTTLSPFARYLRRAILAHPQLVHKLRRPTLRRPTARRPTVRRPSPFGS